MNNNTLIRRFSIALVLLVVSAPAMAQRPSRGLSPAYRFNGRQVTKHFDELIAPTSASTVHIVSKGQRKAMGVVVAPGYVITKASELDGPLGVSTADDKSFRAQLAATDIDNDLALVRVAGLELAPVKWSGEPEAQMGNLVATAWPKAERTRIGIVSAIERPIKRSGGVMGVGLGNDGGRIGGVAIAQVFPKSGAEAAGLKVGDIIVAINGDPVQAREKLIETVTAFDAGDEVEVTVRRGDEKITATVMLGHRSQVFALFNRNQRMSGKTSKRRAGFERVIQHDTALKPEHVGSPLVNLEGEVIALNIARVDRVTSYALPSDVVAKSIKSMMAEAKAKP